MKNNSQSWRMFFIISIILYFVSLIIIFMLVKNIPTQYVDLQNKENTAVKNKIELAVRENNTAEFENIVKNNYVDFVIYDTTTSKVVYSSFAIGNEMEIVNKNANENIISSKDVITVNKDGKDYEVWVINYILSPQKVFDTWIITLMIIIVSLLTIVVVAMLILFYKYIKPIHRLKETVQNISSYQLNVINDLTKKGNSEYDQITKNLQEFSLELETNMNKTGYEYSILERDLMVKNEDVEYKNELLGSLAHDLKAPLTLSVLKLDNVKETYDEKELNNIQNKLEGVIKKINEINSIIFHDNKETFLQHENIDIISVIMDQVSEFEELLDAKNFIIDYDIDDQVIMNVNPLRFKQLVHNALSNIYNHALDDAEVKITCYQEQDKVYLSFYNDCDKLSEEELQKLFSVFYSKSKNNTNSGLGMYTMKNIVDEMNGIITARNHENGLLIEVIFNVET